MPSLVSGVLVMTKMLGSHIVSATGVICMGTGGCECADVQTRGPKACGGAAKHVWLVSDGRALTRYL